MVTYSVTADIFLDNGAIVFAWSKTEDKYID